MKKSIISILSASVIFLTSCGGGGLLGGDQLNDAEGLKAIKTNLETQFGAETEVYSLTLSATDHLTSEFGDSRIQYLDNGVDFSRLYYPTLPQPLGDAKRSSDSFQKEFFLKKKQGKIKIKDFDFDLIKKTFDEAVKLIPEDYVSFSLYEWSFNVDNDNKVSADFSIEGTKKGEGTSLEGRNVVTNYYEFEFKIDEDGKIDFR